MKKQTIIALLTLSLISCNSNKGSKTHLTKNDTLKVWALYWQQKDTVSEPAYNQLYKIRGYIKTYKIADSASETLKPEWVLDSIYYIPVLVPVLDSGKQRLDSLKRPVMTLRYNPALPHQVQWDSNDSIYHPFKFPKK